MSRKEFVVVTYLGALEFNSKRQALTNLYVSLIGKSKSCRFAIFQNGKQVLADTNEHFQACVDMFGFEETISQLLE